MDIHVASIVKNLSLYTIGKRTLGVIPSQVISRGHKKIATYRMNSDAKTALLFSYNPTLLKSPKKGFYFPAIELKNREPDISEQKNFYSPCTETYNDPIVIRNKRDFAILAEQINLIKVLHRGNLNKVIKDINLNKFDLNSGHLEYVTLIEENVESNLAIKLMISKGTINLSLFSTLFENHSLDVSNLFPSAQILKRLISQIEDPDFLHEIYSEGIEAYQNSLRGERSKTSDLVNFVMNNIFTSQELFERIALSDDIDSSDRKLAIKKLRAFDEYSDYPNSWMKKLFNVE
jgi:hypothetical protein